MVRSRVRRSRRRSMSTVALATATPRTKMGANAHRGMRRKFIQWLHASVAEIRRCQTSDCASLAPIDCFEQYRCGDANEKTLRGGPCLRAARSGAETALVRGARRDTADGAPLAADGLRDRGRSPCAHGSRRARCLRKAVGSRNSTRKALHAFHAPERHRGRHPEPSRRPRVHPRGRRVPWTQRRVVRAHTRW
jgi:hypothetical protein